MFCGWQTFFDYNELVNLGSGKLTIDVLSKECEFNNSSIKDLSIAKAFSQWLYEDCKANKIETAFLLKALLIVELDFTIISWSNRKYSKGEQFFDNESLIKNKEMNRCVFNCKSIVETDERTYNSSYSKVREWPIGWPQDT